MKKWIYKHYRWGLYELTWVWIHSETLETYVTYKQLYESDFPIWTVWLRPKEMFEENWKITPRFSYIWNKKYENV